ncbi:MAG: hypothetical protein SPE59_03205 [Treponema sp.]|nr:hypothetical protein [Spirochaetia bacterium]MDY5122788.1 hypothetical protein [Treponema sp.]
MKFHLKNLMMKSRFSKDILIFSLVAFCFTESVFSAPKKKKTDSKKGGGQVTATYDNSEDLQLNAAETPEEETIMLPMQKRTYFYKVEPEILAGVENGSPESLRLAMSKIRKNESEYEANEKVLIYVASKIMAKVWPSEKITWEVFDVADDNPYVGALNSVEKGVFDSSTGNEDFLTTLLPALLVVSPSFDLSLSSQCKNALEAALNRNSSSVVANYLMGVLLEKQSNISGAVLFYKKAYESTNNSKEIALAYSKALRTAGDTKTAAEVISAVSNENDLDVIKQKAYIAFENRELEKAEAYVGRVLQQNPTELEFVLFRAKILVEKNDYIHAVYLLDMYARQESSSHDYLILRARVQLDWSKNMTAATETVEKALQLYPDSIDALMLAARISSITDSPVAGQYADDLAAKVLEKNPGNEIALSYALAGLVQRENWKDAYEISKKLIESSNVDSNSVYNHVLICTQLQKYSEAYEFSKKQHEKNPEDEQLLMAYVLAYTHTGNRDAVVKYIDSLIETSSPKMKSYLYYRRSYLQFSEDKVLADLRSSLISNPRNSDSLLRLYEIYYGKQDYRKAQYYLRQVVAINPNDSSVKKLNEALTKLIN